MVWVINSENVRHLPTPFRPKARASVATAAIIPSISHGDENGPRFAKGRTRSRSWEVRQPLSCAARTICAEMQLADGVGRQHEGIDVW